jgi:diadenosine tetraphosphate (Ap4A) HIT family hydrolase
MSCDTVAGRRQPPGGIVYQDDNWAFFLHSRPLLIPGQGFIVLKRHCERLSELTPTELQTLGSMMQCAEIALEQVLQHVCKRLCYGKHCRHVSGDIQ